MFLRFHVHVHIHLSLLELLLSFVSIVVLIVLHTNIAQTCFTKYIQSRYFNLYKTKTLICLHKGQMIQLLSTETFDLTRRMDVHMYIHPKKQKSNYTPLVGPLSSHRSLIELCMFVCILCCTHRNNTRRDCSYLFWQ